MKEELGSRQTARRDAATRRDFFLSAAPPLATTVLSQVMRGAESTAPRSKMGIASTSFVAGTPMAVAVGPASAAAAATGVPRRPRGRDALEFLEKCHLLGASGI